MTQPQAVALDGRGRLLPGGADAPARVTFGDAECTLALGADSRVASYRDIATIAVSQGATLLVLGTGPGAERFVLERFGQAQGQLVRELRDRRFRQQLADALILVPADSIDLVEYEADEEHGVAQLAYHPWGVVVAPLDERLAWIRLRRGALASVEVDEASGRVTVAASGGPERTSRVVLPGLGERARLHGDRLTGLRRAAQEDAGRLIGALVPDAEYGVRQEAARVLVDGRPARLADLPAAWPEVEAGVLVEPTFAASYATLRSKAGPLAELRAIALAPESPGADEAKSWFFVPLPGNLVALELVNEGAHATYCFRVQRRGDYAGGPTSPGALADAIRDVSEALVDARFLREPMALPDDALRQPAYLRYRLALRVLPSLAAARSRFVARIVHRDEASWSTALDDLIAWHTAARDDAAVWPGRAAQESMVAEAGGDDAGPSGADAAAAAADATAAAAAAGSADATAGSAMELAAGTDDAASGADSVPDAGAADATASQPLSAGGA